MKKLSILALTLVLIAGLMTGCRRPMGDDGTEGSGEDTISTTNAGGTTGLTTPTTDLTLPSTDPQDPSSHVTLPGTTEGPSGKDSSKPTGGST